MPTVRHKRGTSANLAAVNPVPLDGEIVYDQTENAIKIGDGATAWTSLAYVTATPRTHTHSADAITSGTVAYARLPVGSTTSTVCAGDDARLSDARTPTDASVTTAKIVDDAVTYAKLQNVSATDRLLGRSSSGAGNVEEITCTAFGRSLIDDADAAAARTTLGAAPAASPTFTGVVTVPAGTAAAPGVVSTAGTSDTGLLWPAADTVAISTAGSERVRVRSDGLIGVGNSGFANTAIAITNETTSASAIHTGTYSGPTFNAAATSLFNFYSEPQTAGGSVTLIVGFLAAPHLKGGTVSTAVGFRVPTTFTSGATNYGFQSSIASGSNRWNLYADGTAQNYFAGNVGIGASRTTPASALDVNGVITVSATSGSAGSYLPSVCFASDSNTGLGQVGGADSVSLITAGSERVRVDSSGRVGIGRTPSVDGTSLECANDIFLAATKSIVLYHTNKGSGLGSPSNINFQIWARSDITDSIQFQGRDGSTGVFTNYMRIVTGGTGAGNVGVGTTSPSSLLHVNGVITVAAGSAAAPALCISGDANTGIFQASGAADTLSISTAGTERVRVRSDGNVGFGSAGVAHIGMLMQQTLNSTDARSSIFSQPKLTSSFTSDFTGVTSGVELQASASITNSYSFLVRNATLASGASITNQYGLVVPASFTAGSNNYALLLGIPSGSNRWNIYASGTADNYFNGDCGIKTDDPTAALDINADTLRLRTARTPASASAAGNAGDICWDANYVYICVSANSWKRATLASW